MKFLQFIKQYLNNKMIVHASMAAFAVTSTMNVANFFLATHHHWLVASTAGVALGAGLMALSIYLSGQDSSDRSKFYMLLASALAMAVLSGTIQTMGYQMHKLDLFTSCLLGFGPVLTVEILMALSVSSAERAEKERVQRDSKGHMKTSVASAMVATFQNIDAAKIQKYVDKEVDQVIRAYVDSAMSDMLADLHGKAQTKPAPQHADDGTETEAQPVKSRQIADMSAETLPLANQERQRLAAERQRAITELISSYGPLSTAEIVAKLAEDRNVQASERTVRSDCAALESADELVRDGRRWAQPLAIATTLPTMEPVHTNGTAH